MNKDDEKIVKAESFEELQKGLTEIFHKKDWGNKVQFEFDQEMTVGDLIDWLLQFDPNIPVVSSVFKPNNGLIHKQQLKFAQLKGTKDCVYINNYLTR